MNRGRSKVGGKLWPRLAWGEKAAVVVMAVLLALPGISRAQYGAAPTTTTTSTTTTTTTTSNEPGFIKNLHITGYFQNTSATWVNSGAMEYNLDRWGKLNRKARRFRSAATAGL